MHGQAVSSSGAGASSWLGAAEGGGGAATAGVVNLAAMANGALSTLAGEAASNDGPPSTSTYISRTCSGVSDISTAVITAAGSTAAAASAAAGLAPSNASEPLAIKVLRQAQSQGGSMHGGAMANGGAAAGGAAAAGDSGAGPRSVLSCGTQAESPTASVGTPKAALGRPKLSNGFVAPAELPSGLEAGLDGLSINGALSPCDSPINFQHQPNSPSITFQAPPLGSTPRAPVEVFARFPQPQHVQQQPARPQHPRPRPQELPQQAAGAPHSSRGSRQEFTAPRSPHRHHHSNAGPMGGSMPIDPSSAAFLPMYPGYGAPYYPHQVMGSPPQAGMPPPYMMHSAAYYGVVSPAAWYGSGGMAASPSGLGEGHGEVFPVQWPARGAGPAGYEPDFARQYSSLVAYMQQRQGYSGPLELEAEGGWASQRAHISARPRRPGSVGSSSHGSQGSGGRGGGGRNRGGKEVPLSPSAHGSPPSCPSSSPSSRGWQSGSVAGSSSCITTPRSIPSLQLVLDDTEVPSEALDQYKADKEGRDSWQLEAIRGHVYAFCRDQLGSRFVQQSLDGCSQEQVLDLFIEIEPRLLDLMCDVFGNYVIQRFLQVGGGPVQSRVAEALRGRVMALSLQMYGCRVVQKALEVFDPAGKVAIVKELQGHTQQCVRDQNGNHVIQKVIECVQPSDPAWSIIESIVAKTQQLSCHTFGCRLVQRVLEHCTIQQLRERAVSEVLTSCLQLAHDHFGNYVVQHLVAKGPDSARTAVVGRLAPQVMTLAQHKFASNVVEACFKHANSSQRELLIRHMTSEVSQRSGAMLAVMKDQYGNYVVQRALEVADESQRFRLLSAIRPHLATLRKYTYGKHIVARVDAMLAALEEQRAQQQQQPEAGTPAAAMPEPGQQQQAAPRPVGEMPAPVDLAAVAAPASGGPVAGGGGKGTPPPA